MKISRSFSTWMAALAMTASWSLAQTAVSSRPGPRIAPAAPASASNAAQGEIVGEIDDPHTGGCWLLERDPSHPAGPGRLVLTSVGQTIFPRPTHPGSKREPDLPVLRSGDRVVVEEHSAVADARLDAVAMGPALAGAWFQARLAIGGHIVKAVAVGPGRALVGEATR